jgi:hypothetical protein
MQQEKKSENPPQPDKKIVEHSAIQELFKNPFAKVVAAFTAVASIFGIGYGVGIYKQSFDSKIEKMEMKQDCNEKVQTAIENCRETKLTEYSKSVDDIRAIVNELKKKADEK